MHKILLPLLFLLSLSHLTFSQTCPGDINILEDENLEVWKVLTDGDTIHSVAGFQGSVNIGGINYSQAPEFGGYGLIVMAHLKSGTLLWSEQISGAGFFLTNPTLMTNGTNVVVGITEVQGNTTQQLLRFEAFNFTSGAPVWSTSYPINVTTSNISFGAQVMPYDGEVTNLGTYVVSGAFSGSLTIGATTLTSNAGLSESFAMAMDANGVPLWAVQSTGSTGRGRAWTLTIDNNLDEMIIGGYYTGSVNFNGISHTASNTTIINPYLAKLNINNGSAQWVVGMENGTANGFNNIYNLTVDPSSNIYYTGNFNDNISIQGNTVTAISGTEGLIGSVTANGTYRWANQLGGKNQFDEYGATINYSTSANAIFVGLQIDTDSVYYANNYLALPPTHGHHVLGLMGDGNIEPISANALSPEYNFGYDAAYDDVNNILVMASLEKGNGKNVTAAQWIPNRPVPFAYVSGEDDILNPSEILTAFDPGGGIYTYQWYYNDVLLTDSTVNSMYADRNGQYKVEVSNLNGCSTFSKNQLLLDGTTLESDSLVLVDLYNNTDGNNWFDKTNWLTGDVSTWFGVDVNTGRVVNLYPIGNNLIGNLPTSIANLSAIESIDFSYNNISGTLPSNFWNITSLTNIQLCCGNSISGTIPASVGSMSGLVVLDLGGNSFTGNLPSELFDLTTLEYINLWDDADNGMNLTGAIPSTVGGLTSLIAFSLSGNQISGPIPAELGNLNQLITLDLNGNPFKSDVPPELGDLSSLTSFNLSFCELTGTFPDAIWQLPSLQNINLSGNGLLEVILPANLGSLTQFNDIRLDQTLPRGGAFPTDFYSLNNLIGLSLGNKQYTGTLDPVGVSNWTQLDNIYLWNNLLDGTFPSEISAATNLRALNISNNNFTDFPNLSSLSNLQELDIRSNQFDFDDISPNIGVSGVLYLPQKQRGANQYLEVDENGSIDFINPYTASGNQYQWVKNRQNSTTGIDYNIIGAKLSDLGSYYATVTNPSVPDLTLQTNYFNVAFSGDPRSWSVDNSPESLADFKSFYAALYGTNDGDTLYVAGSDIPYNVGGLRLDKQRYIYGPGYFLAENEETQAFALEAQVPYINIYEGAAGTEIRGMTWDGIYLNPQSSFLDGILADIKISGNKIYDMTIGDKNENITIDGNYIDYFSFWSTTPSGGIRTYNNITIQNNIIDTVTTTIAKATAARNEMTNVNFNRNTISVFLDSISDATLTNNIINDYQATGNTVTNNRNFSAANFLNVSATLSIDNDYQTTNPAFNAGAFSGSNPYKLSGLSITPHIFSITDVGRIRYNINAKNESPQDIKYLNYRIGNNGNVLVKGTVNRLVPGNPVEVLFRPKVSEITPGGTYTMMIWAKDATGLKSVSHNVTFVATTTNSNGQITTSDNLPVTSGEVFLFEINQEGTAFDTLATTLNNQGLFSFSNIVIGDYLAIGKPNKTNFPTQLPTYYQRIDLWEEADTLLIDATNPEFNIKLLAKPKDETGNGMIAGFIDEELDQGTDSGGRIDARGRVSGASVSMRRGKNLGRTEKVVYELVSYTASDENGEFLFEKLPVGNYRINVQYPGYPMDTLSDVDIVIEENKNNAYNLAALVDKGEISITILSTTGLLKELIRNVSVYPNPAIEQINIEFNQNVMLKGPVEIEIVSAKGEVVFKQNYDSEQLNKDGRLTLPVSIYNSGTYIVNIKEPNQQLGTIRIVISK